MLNEIDMSYEQWKDIEGLNSIFQVSNYGRIRRLGFVSKSGKYLRFSILKNQNTSKSLKNKHMVVECYDGFTKEHVSVSRTVYRHFVNNSDDQYIIKHKDGNKENCRADNLIAIFKNKMSMGV